MSLKWNIRFQQGVSSHSAIARLSEIGSPEGVTCHGDEMRHRFMFCFINLECTKNTQKDKANIKHWRQNKVPDFLLKIFDTIFIQRIFHVKHTWDRQILWKILIYENAESHVIICICLWFAAPHVWHIVIFTNRYMFNYCVHSER